MKRFLKISVLSLAAILGFAACDNDEFVYVPEEPQIEVITSDILFEAMGGTGSVTVEAKGSISATCASEWCSVSVSGNTITATAEPNPGLDGRSAQIVVSCNNKETILTAQQKGMGFSFQDAEYIIPMRGADIVLEGSSSLPTTYEAPDWIEVDNGLGAYLISIGPNDTGAERKGSVVITAGEMAATLTFTQIVFTFVDQTFEFGINGGTIDVVGTSSMPVTVTADSWITATKTDDGYKLTVGENTAGAQRTGTFVITAGDVSATITIVQKYDRDFSGTYTFWRYKSSTETDANHVSATVTITRDAKDPNLFNVTGWNGITIPMHYDATRNQLYIENCVYLGKYSDGNYLYACKNYRTDSSNYLNYAVGNPNYYTWFDFEYVDGKYNILFNNAPPASSNTESTGFTIYTFSVAPDSGVALATANRVASIWIVRRPQFIGE